MKRLWVFIFSVGLAFLALVSPTWLADAEPEARGSLSFQVRDSQTGYRVEAELELRSQDGAATALLADGTGRAAFFSAPGTYTVRVEAAGYHPLETYFVIVSGGDLQAEVLLDPQQTPPELKAEQLGQLLALGGDSTIFHGYIVDGESGQPLEGVQVRMEGSAIASLSDSRGYLVLSVPAPASTGEDLPPLGTLLFSKAGYKTVAYRDLFLTADLYLLRVSLEPGEGEAIRENGHRALASEEPE